MGPNNINDKQGKDKNGSYEFQCADSLTNNNDSDDDVGYNKFSMDISYMLKQLPTYNKYIISQWLMQNQILN